MFDFHRLAARNTPQKLTQEPDTPDTPSAMSEAAAAVSSDTATAAAGVGPLASQGSMTSNRRRRAAPFLIGVAGGTASGKTTVCDMIMQRLRDNCVVMINQDSFYRDLTPDEKRQADAGAYNFDHPDAFDRPALMDCIMKLREGKPVDVPTYDFTQHRRGVETRRVDPADVIIVEGIMVLHMEEVRALCNMKVFVDTDDDVRLARRIQRDVAERGRDVAGVITQYTKFVKPMFDQYVAPSRRQADVILPWAKGSNLVAIDLIVEHIRTKLQQHEMRRIYPNLEVIPSNFQIQGMHTIMRDRNTSKEDFVFYADRLNRLVVEAGLGHLPFSEACVTTPTGHPYCGVAFARKLCGVSIIRSGEAMESALRACCKGIKIGKILVHRHTEHSEVIYEKLPADIAERHVMLMDPLLSTGGTAVKAIQILKDKGVPEDRILFLAIIAAPEGIHKVCTNFPQVTLITSDIDDYVDEHYAIVPGCGNYGDRYFSE